jgi:hypothetical protein
MKNLGYIFCLSWIILLGSCDQNDVYTQGSKTLDSLSGAINSMVSELNKTDTIALERSILRFNYYKQFIQQNIHDTIEKNDADNLQHFYISGHNLESFASNRKIIVTRAKLVNSQLEKLNTDIKNRAVQTEELSNYSYLEKQHAAGLLDAGYAQMKVFHSGLEEFKNSLRGIEALIRSRNNGELPTIVKDSVAL